MLEMEDLWAESAEVRSLSAREINAKEYSKMRDTFKANHILALYGYDYFIKFVERCPHIQEMLTKYKPCE